jgi:hypothetical protein
MRHLGWILIVCLMPAPCARAVEFFGDFLYWQATEPVDWILTNNRLPTDQVVAFDTIGFDYTPGFRVGVALDGDWGSRFYYTRLRTSAEDSASGNIQPMFIGGKFSLQDEVESEPFYYNEGHMKTVIDYNVLDWDLGKRYQPVQSLTVRPLVGLRAAWINQSFDSEFQGSWYLDLLTKDEVEHIENNFWGIGPKFGVESTWNIWGNERCKLNGVLIFYTAYLLGNWSIKDVSNLTTVFLGQTTTSQRVVPIHNRDFGALTFQAIAGVNLQWGRWSATAGYELNDWLNQCQFFDDATGPHNNDLIFQGLTVNLDFRF